MSEAAEPIFEPAAVGMIATISIAVVSLLSLEDVLAKLNAMAGALRVHLVGCSR